MGKLLSVDYYVELATLFYCEAVEYYAAVGDVDGSLCAVYSNGYSSVSGDNDCTEDRCAGNDLAVLDYLVIRGSTYVGEALKLVVTACIVGNVYDSVAGSSLTTVYG